MKRRILVDVKVVCDPPDYIYRLYGYDIYSLARELESWCREFEEFVRDHRSQDPVSLYIEKVYEEVCEFCNRPWETDEDGAPICCEKAEIEWKKLAKESVAE